MSNFKIYFVRQQKYFESVAHIVVPLCLINSSHELTDGDDSGLQLKTYNLKSHCS